LLVKLPEIVSDIRELVLERILKNKEATYAEIVNALNKPPLGLSRLLVSNKTVADMP